MSSASNSNSSSNHPSSKPQSLERQEKRREDTESRSATKDGFDPDTITQIAHIARAAPPSLVSEELGKTEEEHPLLSLHQSVSGSGNKKTGNRSRENKSQPQHSQTSKSAVMVYSNNEKTSSGSYDNTTGSNAESRLDPPKSNEMNREGEMNRKKKRSFTSKAAMVIIIAILCVLLMNSVIVNNPNIKENLPEVMSDLSAGVTAAQSGIISHVQEWSSIIFGAGNSIQMEQFENRLEVGQNLLRKYDDASGSASACKRTFHAILKHIGGDENVKDNFVSLVTSMSSSIEVVNANENRLLMKALLCIGEARLALFYSPFGSLAIRKEQLVEARESFEAGTALDPTNPSVRSGLGLSYLFLGVMNYDGDIDNSKQSIFQSIQHLKATLGLVKDVDSEATDDVIAIRTAATHNLGLAYMALDGFSSSDGLSGDSAHYSNWVTSLRSSEASSSLMESWVFSANEGALLLQNGKIEDAISTLEATASEVCIDDSFLATSRQKEMCLIVQQNLAVARAAQSGEQQESSSVFRQSGGGTKVHDQVARWNAAVTSDSSPAEVSDAKQIKDVDDIIAAADDDVTNTTTAEKDEASSQGENTNIEEESKSEAPHEAIDEEPTSLSSWGLKNVKPEMRHALSSLEKAATEGPHRTRLLLALARARSSAGDSSGAVDAALKAINAASSSEESETATSYLETLMEKMAEEDEDDMVKVVPEEELSLEKVEKNPSSFIEGKDFALTELQLRLELERLKYKVLEQEMRLGGQHRHNQQQYRDEMQEMRAIDYRQEEEHIVEESSRRQTSDPVKEKIVTIKTSEETLDHDTIVELIEEEPAPTDTVEESKTEDSAGNETVIEPQNADADSLSDTVAVDDAEASPDTIAIDDDAAASLDTTAIDDVSASSDAVVADGIDSDEVTNEDQGSPEETEGDDNTTDTIEDVPVVEPIELPSLYGPTLEPPKAMPPTARSYMKMADAYLDKGNYGLAWKQFRKVIKKAPDHLPAHLGYATALERDGKNKQINTAALAYGNATKVAITQGERVDPMSKAGAGGIAENILRRAIQLAKSATSGRLEILRELSSCAHTASLAADTYYEIGMEVAKQGIDQGDNKVDAVQAFTIANEFVAVRNDTDIPYHIGSIVELGKIALEYESDASRVIELFDKVKNMHMEDNLHVELLVLVGRAYLSLGELETAISEFTRALSLPQSASTQSAHYELAIALKKGSGDTHEINLHFEKALDMGMDPTQEVIEALGERNMSVMRALNRQYYKNYNTGGAEKSGGGGIMSGGGVGSQSSSVFAPQAKQAEDVSAQSQTLSLLEQGAASYDGQSPMGGAVEGADSSLSNLKAKKQQGSESNLSNLKR